MDNQDRNLGKLYLIAIMKREGKTEIEISKILKDV
jgi:hypothetical protein